MAKLATCCTFHIVVFSFDTRNARRLSGRRLSISTWALLARWHVRRVRVVARCTNGTDLFVRVRGFFKLPGQTIGARCTSCHGRSAFRTRCAFGGSVFVRGIGVYFAKLASRRTFDIVVFSFDAWNAQRLLGRRLGIPKWALFARWHV